MLDMLELLGWSGLTNILLGILVLISFVGVVILGLGCHDVLMRLQEIRDRG